ncbi:MAG: hypothetical protein KDD55_10380 [Bdellovibrionales bacterium]|nr:hypothetical protein [Bdellovibrionales bacterium]
MTYTKISFALQLFTVAAVSTIAIALLTQPAQAAERDKEILSMQKDPIFDLMAAANDIDLTEDHGQLDWMVFDCGDYIFVMNEDGEIGDRFKFIETGLPARENCTETNVPS